MAARGAREHTNLTDYKEKILGKGKDRIDDREITSQRMVAKGKENYTTTLDIIKGKIEKNRINKGNKHELCGCGRLKLVEDKEDDDYFFT